MAKRNELEGFFLECIEETKKDVLKRRDHQSRSSKFSLKSTKYSDPGNSNVKLGNFQSSDKQMVIERLMQNDSILIFLYEKLFPASSLQSNPPIKKVPTSQSVLNAGSQLTLLTQDGLA